MGCGWDGSSLVDEEGGGDSRGSGAGHCRAGGDISPVTGKGSGAVEDVVRTRLPATLDSKLIPSGESDLGVFCTHDKQAQGQPAIRPPRHTSRGSSRSLAWAPRLRTQHVSLTQGCPGGVAFCTL